jgi:peptide-methionine (S)-S-oxide reductase
MPKNDAKPDEPDSPATLAHATFGGGCFWCIEAVFERIDGVKSAVSGYAGGPIKNPTYEQVCSGRTGHAEVVQVTFDSSKVSYEKLLEVFFACHDPTTLNRQGPDVGTQYRSIILTEDEAQTNAAKQYIASLDEAKGFSAPVVTQVEPLTQFFEAEPNHQDYYRNNSGAGYCRVMIAPKLKKLGLE